MDDKEFDLPDLLWSCFINWINTLENQLKKNPEIRLDIKKHLRIK